MDHQALQDKLEAQLAAWKTQAEELRAKAEGVGADLRDELTSQLDKLRDLQADAQGKLSELRALGEDQVGELKGRVEQMVSDATGLLKSVADRFK